MNRFVGLLRVSYLACSAAELEAGSCVLLVAAEPVCAVGYRRLWRVYLGTAFLGLRELGVLGVMVTNERRRVGCKE